MNYGFCSACRVLVELDRPGEALVAVAAAAALQLESVLTTTDLAACIFPPLWVVRRMNQLGTLESV